MTIHTLFMDKPNDSQIRPYGLLLFISYHGHVTWVKFTSVFLWIQMILPLYFTHAWLRVDLVFVLLLDIWWFCFDLGSCKWKRKRKKPSSWFQGKVIFFENLIFTNFMTVFDIFLNGIHHINLVKIEDMKWFFLSSEESAKKITVKMKLAKWRQKHISLFFQRLAQF